MARAKYGHIFSEVSGSIGGMTVQQSLSGTIIRNKPVRKGKTSAYTELNHNIFSLVNAAWLALSPENRAHWEVFSKFAAKSQHHNPSLILSAKDLFSHINYYRFAYGISQLSSPPFVNTPPKLYSKVFKIVGANILCSFSETIDPALEFVIIKATVQLNQITNAFKSKLKLLPFATQNSNLQIFTTAYTDRFGIDAAKNMRIGFAVTVQNIASGKMSPWQNMITIL